MGYLSLNPNADPFVYNPPIPSLIILGYGSSPNYLHQNYPIYSGFFSCPPSHGFSLSHPQGYDSKYGNFHKYVPPHVHHHTTTLMIKNIPNQFRRNHLLNILDEHCKWKNSSCENKRNNNNSDSRRRSEYDFVYLPMDFRKYWYDGKFSNLGYAFVNFTNPTAASEFYKAFHRRQWDVLVNKKVCEIKRAKIQGLKALMDAFKNKIFWCHANNYLPVMLEPSSDGYRRYRAMAVGKRISRPPPSSIKKCVAKIK